MKIPVIRKIVETVPLDALRQAEEDLMEEKPLQVSIEGEDEGEQLTHIYAAIFILEEMANSGVDLKQALRTYTQKVRNSIS